MGTTPTTEATQTPTPEQQAQEAKDAEAGFEAGFNKVRGEEPAPDEKKDTPPDAGKAADTAATPAATSAGAAAAPAAAAAAPAKDPWEGVPPVVRQRLEAMESIPGQIRNLAGHIGGLKSEFQKALTTARDAVTERGGAAPSDKQVQAALSDPKAFEKLMEDYPELAGPVEKELKFLHGELAKRSAAPPVDPKALTKGVVDQLAPSIEAVGRRAREFAYVDVKHEGWEDTVRTPEFAGWLKSQAPDVQALASSSKAKDAVKLLDTYKASPPPASGANPDRQRERLQGALTPKGTSSPIDTGLSDDQAFERGFKRVRAK